MSLIELLCDVDDFCQEYETNREQFQLENGLRQRRRRSSLSLSEVMTIIIYFHQSNYRTFKAYYTKHVQVHMQTEISQLVNYSCFVRSISRAFVPLAMCLFTNRD